jgi:hypothetical protein
MTMPGRIRTSTPPLICSTLLAAVPGTILLEVLTGKPTVPGTVTAGPGAATPAPEIAAASCWAWPVS